MRACGSSERRIGTSCGDETLLTLNTRVTISASGCLSFPSMIGEGWERPIDSGTTRTSPPLSMAAYPFTCSTVSKSAIGELRRVDADEHGVARDTRIENEVLPGLLRHRPR